MDQHERAERFRAEAVEAAHAAGVARRHEEQIAHATEDGVLSIEDAEQAYALAEQESLEPAYALALVRSGYLVRELVPPDPPDEAMQGDAPGWIRPVEGDDLVHERRLRASLRRLRHMLERCAGPAEAVDAYLAEPDVAPAD